MKQKFFIHSEESNFIKQLLANTPIPLYRTVHDNELIIKDFTYIYKCNLIKCTQSGLINFSAKYKILDHYDLYNYNPQLSELYYSHFNYYDSETHEKFGALLRAYRDIKDLNLMPFYNCFSNSYISGLKIGPSASNKNKLVVYQSRDDSVKTVLIPIKFNTEYTIALDCASSVYIAPIFLHKGLLVIPKTESDQLDITAGIGNISGNIQCVNGTSFTKPIVYQTSLSEIEIESSISSTISNKIVINDDKVIDIKSVKINNSEVSYFQFNRFKNELTLSQFYQVGDLIEIQKVYAENADLYEKYARDIYMLIQIPANNNSSISVLEGNYLNCANKKIFNVEYIDEIPEEHINNLLLSKLTLLQLNDFTQHPFSDRLIEYILHNVISNQELIPKNISRIQSALAFDVNTKREGIWTKDLRNKIFQTYSRSISYVDLDINGFLDKDTEYFLEKGILNNGIDIYK